MGLDLTVCSLTPDFDTSIVLLIEYFVLLILLTFSFIITFATEEGSFEVFMYHGLCLVSCLLRIIIFTYNVLFGSDTRAFKIVLFLAPLPFLSAITILAATWWKMYMHLCDYSDEKLNSLLKLRKILLILWNFIEYLIAAIILSLINTTGIDCKL